MTDMLRIRIFNFYLDKDKINTTATQAHTQFSFVILLFDNLLFFKQLLLYVILS